MTTASCVVLALIFLTPGCETSVFDVQLTSAGDILDVKRIQVFSTQQIAQILHSHQIPDSFQLSYPVEALSVVYQTTDAYGLPIRVSGALLIPLDDRQFPILSIQHGTQTRNDLVASVHPTNSTEGIAGLLTASMGYVTCIPDYPGFGVSKTPHPYMHARSLTPCVIDLLNATQSYCINRSIALSGQLFLTGYSEGGFVTLAVQKELETGHTSNLNIVAVAPMAGPYDLTGMFDVMLRQSTYPSPAFVVFFINAYDAVYRWHRLQEILLPPYSTIAPALFDGSMSYGDINAQLPPSLSLLLQQSFVDSFLNGADQPVRNAVAENTLLDWTPVAPVHFYHGDADEIVPYQNAITAATAFTANGATSIQLTVIPGGTHETAGAPALLGALGWLDSIRAHDAHMGIAGYNQEKLSP